jgi:hypothetical protein
MKVSGSYVSLVRGVSQQVPQDRGPGQHTEQINLIPDPVKGLTRRHGSRYQAEASLALPATDIAAITADTENWRTFEYSNAGKDYVILCRREAQPVGSDLPPMIVYNRTDSAFLTYARNAVDAQLDLLESGGISAIAAIGKYVFMAGHSTVASATSTDLWADSANQARAVVWIRGGAYARKFSVTATKTDNTQIDFEYTTPTSSYPGVLDTSGVPVYAADPAGGTSTDTESAYITDDGAGGGVALLSWSAWGPSSLSAKKGTTTMTNVFPAAPANNLQYSAPTLPGPAGVTFHSSNIGALDVTMTYTHIKTVTNPNYAKTVTDITNAYNSAVTNWIGDAATAITPAAIAESLKTAAVAAGLTSAVVNTSSIIFDNVKALAVNDGGDGTLIRGVANEVTSVDQVSDLHYVGKIIKIRARDSKEAFYLKAVAKDGISTGYAEVTWVEGAGTEHAITNALLYGTASGSTFYVASSSTLLTAILAGTHPSYDASTAGDGDSSPLPYFIGKKITYLGVFQDRLLVGAGAVLRCSQIGNYLNFFRSSILTVPADDPLEVLSQGSEDDELRHSVLYDRDLVIFGKLRQYAISGRVALTPTSANMQVMSSHSNAADVPPLAVGGVIFYGQVGERASSLHQIQPGQVAESPESYILSSQIDTYIQGRVIEIANHSKPTHMFMRASELRNSLYCYTYLDKDGQGRVQDAWSRWDFNAALGPIIGMSRTAEGLLVYRVQTGIKEDASGSNCWVVTDLCPLTTGLSEFPYLDSLRPWADVDGADKATHQNTLGDWHTAFDGSSEFRFIGGPLADTEDLLEEFPTATGPYVGAMQYASFVPTNPFVRDKNDKAITSGRLVVTTILASTEDTSGFTTVIDTKAGSTSTDYNGRVLGDPENEIGREPVSDGLQSIPIGKESREFVLSIVPRTWMPFTLTTLEWVGQFFNRTQRF